MLIIYYEKPITKKVNILIAFFFVGLIFIWKTNFNDISNSKKIKSFYDLLPYINNNQKKPNSLKEIYESNILYTNI